MNYIFNSNILDVVCHDIHSVQVYCVTAIVLLVHSPIMIGIH